MNCKTASNYLSAWLDGELEVSKAAFLQHHLDACRDCSLKVSQLQTVLAVLRESRAPVAVPDGFSARVMERLQAEPQCDGQRTHLLFKKLAFAASFIFLLGMNSLLLGRYQSGGGQATLPPTALPPVKQTEQSPPPDSLPVQLQEPSAPAPSHQQVELPLVQAPAEQAGSGLSVTAAPDVRQPVPVVPSGRTAAAQALKPRSAALSSQAAPLRTPKPAAAKQPLRVASLSPTVIPDSEVFLPKRRVTEGRLLKIAVRDLPQAAELLAEAAGMRGLAPTVASVSLAPDGRLIALYRFEVPWQQANMFINQALSLGLVLDERQITEDISVEYREKLEQYRQLAARVHDAEGAEATALHNKKNDLLLDLARMHNAASGAQAVTVWLEA